MFLAGIIILMFCFFAVLVITQVLFLRASKRLIWRAFMPYWLRKTLLPHDPVVLDSFATFEEYSAVMLAGAFLMLPLVVVSSMGFITIF